MSDAAGMARVHVDSWRSTYRGIVPDEYLAQLSYDGLEERWVRNLQGSFPGVRTFVAEDASGTIAGFAGGGPERDSDPVYRGELYVIYLLPAYQRSGIGRRLFSAVVDHLLALGLNSMLVWVLADNPSRRFYETLGGHLLRSQTIEIGGATLAGVAYGWDNLMRISRTDRD